MTFLPKHVASDTIEVFPATSSSIINYTHNISPVLLADNVSGFHWIAFAVSNKGKGLIDIVGVGNTLYSEIVSNILDQFPVTFLFCHM